MRYVDLDDGYGNKVLDDKYNPIQVREYVFQNNRNETIIIQEYSLGYEKVVQNKGLEPHFNVRPISNTNTGSVKGTHGHYHFRKR